MKTNLLFLLSFFSGGVFLGSIFPATLEQQSPFPLLSLAASSEVPSSYDQDKYEAISLFRMMSLCNAKEALHQRSEKYLEGDNSFIQEVYQFQNGELLSVNREGNCYVVVSKALRRCFESDVYNIDVQLQSTSLSFCFREVLQGGIVKKRSDLNEKSSLEEIAGALVIAGALLSPRERPSESIPISELSLNREEPAPDRDLQESKGHDRSDLMDISRVSSRPLFQDSLPQVPGSLNSEKNPLLPVIQLSANQSIDSLHPQNSPSFTSHKHEGLQDRLIEVVEHPEVKKSSTSEMISFSGSEKINEMLEESIALYRRLSKEPASQEEILSGGLKIIAFAQEGLSKMESPLKESLEGMKAMLAISWITEHALFLFKEVKALFSQDAADLSKTLSHLSNQQAKVSLVLSTEDEGITLAKVEVQAHLDKVTTLYEAGKEGIDAAFKQGQQAPMIKALQEDLKKIGAEKIAATRLLGALENFSKLQEDAKIMATSINNDDDPQLTKSIEDLLDAEDDVTAAYGETSLPAPSFDKDSSYRACMDYALTTSEAIIKTTQELLTSQTTSLKMETLKKD